MIPESGNRFSEKIMLRRLNERSSCRSPCHRHCPSSIRLSEMLQAMPPKSVPPARPSGRSADLILFPELFVAGYPPEDLVVQAGLSGRLSRGHRGHLARDRAGQRGHAGQHARTVENGKLRNAVAPFRRRTHLLTLRFKSICPITACSTRSATVCRWADTWSVSSAYWPSAMPIPRRHLDFDPTQFIAGADGALLLVPSGAAVIDPPGHDRRLSSK